jgi:predicted DCC family thiol-disulfide oxidoreductase YuxK
MGANNPIKPVIFFDGVCNLCNESVLFVIKRDRKGKFNFAPIQSSYAEHQLKGFDYSTQELNTILLLKNGKLYQKSSAVLEIAKGLSGGWPLLYAFIIVPVVIRNFVYDWVARNRYKWFGKKEACMIPTPELRARFKGN